MARGVGRVNTAAITHIAAAVSDPVGVDELLIPTGFRDADAVLVARHRREVAQADDGRVHAFRLSKVGDDGVVGVAEINPLKSVPVKVDFVQRRFLAIDSVQVADQTLQPTVGFILAEMPIQAGVMVPFPPLAELSTHEQHFLAGVAVHIAIEQPEVRKPLPNIAGHFVEQRPFTVHHFVMGEGEDKIFAEGVEQTERELVLVEPAVDRVVLEKGQQVVHPSHVPLERKTEPSRVGWPRDTWP